MIKIVLEKVGDSTNGCAGCRIRDETRWFMMDELQVAGCKLQGRGLASIEDDEIEEREFYILSAFLLLLWTADCARPTDVVRAGTVVLIAENFINCLRAIFYV